MPQWDLANADCIIVMGSNMAENHPIAFRFVLQAKDKGATIIHVDPRFTRTSALADIYAPIRAGSDIAFLGGLIHYILERDLWFKEYALTYTNLSTIIDERFQDASALDGLFSGFDQDSRSYKYDSWQYQGEDVPASLAEHYVNTTESYSEKLRRMEKGPPPRDPTLQHPNTVYQILKRHYAPIRRRKSRKLPAARETIFLKIAEALTRASGRERTAAFCYAVGWTHHTVGVQIIRAAALIQALLGQYRPARRRHPRLARPFDTSKAAPTSRPSTICCRAICRSRTLANLMIRYGSILRPKRRRPGSGIISRNTWSAYCAPGTASMPRKTINGVFRGFRVLSVITRSCR